MILRIYSKDGDNFANEVGELSKNIYARYDQLLEHIKCLNENLGMVMERLSSLIGNMISHENLILGALNILPANQDNLFQVLSLSDYVDDVKDWFERLSLELDQFKELLNEWQLWPIATLCGISQSFSETEQAKIFGKLFFSLK